MCKSNAQCSLVQNTQFCPHFVCKIHNELYTYIDIDILFEFFEIIQLLKYIIQYIRLCIPFHL